MDEYDRAVAALGTRPGISVIIGRAWERRLLQLMVDRRCFPKRVWYTDIVRMVIDLDRSRDVTIQSERPKLIGSGKFLRVFTSNQDAEAAASLENMDLTQFVRRKDVFIPTERWAARWASSAHVNWTDRAMSEKARRRVGDRRSPADIAADQRCEDYDLRLTLTAQGAWNVKIADVKLMLKDKPGSDVFYLPTATRWRMVAAWDESAFLKRPRSTRTLTRAGSRHVQRNRTHKSSDDKDSETVGVFHNHERIIGSAVLFSAAFCEQEYRDLFDPTKTASPRQPSGTRERVAVQLDHALRRGDFKLTNNIVWNSTETGWTTDQAACWYVDAMLHPYWRRTREEVGAALANVHGVKRV